MKLPFPAIILITDNSGDVEHIFTYVTAAIHAGVRIIQTRERKLADKDYLALLHKLKKSLQEVHGFLLVNERVDLALACDADGVQLGYRSYTPVHARKLLGAQRYLGLSVHCQQELRELDPGLVDFALVGPVFATPSKQGILSPIGLTRLHQWVTEAQVPVIAIGGIHAANVREVAETGVYGVAAIRALQHGSDIKTAVSTMLQAFHGMRTPKSSPCMSESSAEVSKRPLGPAHNSQR